MLGFEQPPLLYNAQHRICLSLQTCHSPLAPLPACLALNTFTSEGSLRPSLNIQSLGIASSFQQHTMVVIPRKNPSSTAGDVPSLETVEQEITFALELLIRNVAIPLKPLNMLFLSARYQKMTCTFIRQVISFEKIFIYPMFKSSNTFLWAGELGISLHQRSFCLQSFKKNVPNCTQIKAEEDTLL